MMTMPKSDCRYYTTSVPASRSVREVVTLMAGKPWFQGLQQLYDDSGHTYGLRFQMEDPETGGVPVQIFSHKNRLIEMYEFKDDQARRVAWRQIKHWIEAQIMVMESGLMRPHETFLAKALIRDGKNVLTMGDFYKDHRIEVEDGPPELSAEY